MKRERLGQQGMASFMVTSVLILVISLIAIGVAQVARKNQQETLNRQLSSQAYYAAESGVNKTVSIIRDRLSAGGQPADKTSCDTNNTEYPPIQLDGTSVEVTCVLVTMESKDLYYSAVTENEPLVIPLETSGMAPFTDITLTWRPKSGGATPTSTCGTTGYTLPERNSWACGHGMLRTDLTDMTALQAGRTAMSTFFYPHRNDSSTPPTVAYSGGGLVEGRCTDTGDGPKCTAKITGLSSTVYYLSARSIYKDSSLQITGRDANNSDVRFKGQAIVDVTAKAQDVLRRIQARVPLESRTASTIPAAAIETSGSLCKRFSVSPSYYRPDPSVPCN